MIGKSALRKIALARLEDSVVLFNNNRYDSALYLCGYAVEIALKCRICETLQWAGYPSTNKDFENLKSFKTHSLEVLLTLSGVETEIKNKFFIAWSAIEDWEPEIRYNPVGSADEQKTRLAIESARILLSSLKIL